MKHGSCTKKIKKWNMVQPYKHFHDKTTNLTWKI